jgi:uncharacterized protein (TIGR03435 family)
MMSITMRLQPDGILISGLPLEKLMQMTFGLPENRIFNEPGWVKSGQFDIQAKVDPADAPKMKDLTINERWSMMLPVLQDRFGLKFHRETRTVEVYALVIAAGGSKLKEAQNDPTNQSGAVGRTMMRFTGDELVLDSNGGNLESLAKLISQQLGSTVVDKTGLNGKYDYTLKWASDRMLDRPTMPAARQETPDEAIRQAQATVQRQLADDVGAASGPPPALPTALKEQLGLKLVSQKEPVEVVVIDQIQQPSPN